MRRAAMALMLGAMLPVTAATATSQTAGAPPTVASVFQAFGLFGTWAVDCARPAAPTNPHVTDVMAGPDLVIEHNDLGPDRELNRYSILAARSLSATEVALEVVFQPGSKDEQAQRLVLAVHDGTRRTLFNQPEGGRVRVKDGVAVGYGLKTPTLHKCE